MLKIGGERSTVQNPLIEYAKEVGWQYINSEEALRLRGGETGLILRDVFVNQISRLNSEFANPVIIEELIKKLRLLPNGIEGNLQAWEYLKGLKTVFVPQENRERNLKIIDKDANGNVFHVTDEFSYTNGMHTNRYDVVFLINGVPILFVETKAAAKFFGDYIERESIIAEALEQVKRYHRETPEAMTLFQLYVVTNIIHFLYSATWNSSLKSVFNWKTESGEKKFEKLVKTFFNPQRVVDIIHNFILFTRQDDELRKVVLRPHQMRAVNKLIQRAQDKEKKRALVWHTQGSGKTYTMIVTAQRILENPIFENPTVIMLVDRNELEAQLFSNLSSCGIEHVVIADSKKHLRSLLKNDTRGLIVSTIHKFEDMPPNINTRENIFVLIDEAHRTTGGKLGNYLMGALPNATYIGFTGTPIDKTSHGNNTFVIFGKDDPPKGYLDKYGIAESVEDGTTVQLHYTLAPNELRPDRETLEKEFLNLAEAEGMSDVETLNHILDKAVTLKNMMKTPERIEKIAKYVAEHYKDYIEPMGYKAFLVAVDREACALYKEELDKYLPPEYSEVIYSQNHNDSPILKKYHHSEDEEKRIRKAFRDPDKLPKILIVTEKLLTGFDAPILYCMYLDKPMRDHVLLQAIARVNRPYEDTEGRKKKSGLIIDFVGIFDKLEKALAFDSGDISEVVHDIEILKERFKELMEEAKKYLKIIEGKVQDKATEAVLEEFSDKEKRKEFYETFKELSEIFEIISPDPFLRPYLEDYDTLARMLKIVREAYERTASTLIDRDFLRKTIKLVQENTLSGKIKPSLEIFEINEETLKKLEESKASDTEKVFNLIRSIEEEIRKSGDLKPYLKSIGEKAEEVAEMFKNRQITTLETLEELKKIVQEINEANKEQEEKNMSTDEFTVYWILRQEGLPKPESTAREIGQLFEDFNNWKNSERYERELKRHIIKVLLNNGLSSEEALNLTNKILMLLKRWELN